MVKRYLQAPGEGECKIRSTLPTPEVRSIRLPQRWAAEVRRGPAREPLGGKTRAASAPPRPMEAAKPP
jgi:hypothetical protein